MSVLGRAAAKVLPFNAVEKLMPRLKALLASPTVSPKVKEIIRKLQSTPGGVEAFLKAHPEVLG